MPIPQGYPAFSVDEAEVVAKKLIEETKSNVVVVKAQIHAGGRGTGGGVKVANGGVAEARELAQKILGMQLVTHHTGPARQQVRRRYIEQGPPTKRELHRGAAIGVDRRHMACVPWSGGLLGARTARVRCLPVGGGARCGRICPSRSGTRRSTPKHSPQLVQCWVTAASLCSTTLSTWQSRRNSRWRFVPTRVVANARRAAFQFFASLVPAPPQSCRSGKMP